MKQIYLKDYRDCRTDTGAINISPKESIIQEVNTHSTT